MLIAATSTGEGFNIDNILERNLNNPGLNSDYSILNIANGIKDLSPSPYFEVMH